MAHHTAVATIRTNLGEIKVNLLGDHAPVRGVFSGLKRVF